MKIKDLSPKQLRSFHKRLGKALKVKFYSTGWFARLLRMAYDRFIKQYLPLPPEIFDLRPFFLKNRVFLDVAPGSQDRSPLEQILVAIHECTHVLRCRVYPGTIGNWYGSYFNQTNTTFRALEEGSCQEAEGQLVYWAKGVFPGLDLTSYLCSDDAVHLAQVAYAEAERHTKERGRGHATHRAAQVAMQILISMGVERD